MVRIVKLDAEVPPNREVHLTLPTDVPVGPAEITLTVRPHNGSHRPTLGDLAQSEFFGSWRDRQDITDSAEFATDLRKRGWKRDQ